MSPSRFRSSTSAALAALALVAPACNGDDCGPIEGTLANGISASSSEVTITYTDLSALAGNDCPDPDAPAGVVSISIEGHQEGNTSPFTVCIPRPDLLTSGQRTLGTALSQADIRLIDVQGNDGTCTYTLDSSRPPTGMGTGLGVCENGTHDAGFELELNGAISLRRTCGATQDSIAVTLRGRAIVTKRAQ